MSTTASTERILRSVWYELRVAGFIILAISAAWFLLTPFQPWAIGYASQFLFVAAVLFLASQYLRSKERRR